MPYQVLLDNLVRAVEGAEAALLLDSEGELVLGAGATDSTSRLIGAYQGLALAVARRAGERHVTGRIDCMLASYAGRHVLLRPLRDGYYLVVLLHSRANLGQGLYRSQRAQERLDEEL